MGRKTLKRGAFPSIFKFKKQIDAQKRSFPRKRKFLENFIIENVSKKKDINLKINNKEQLIDFEVDCSLKSCSCCVKLQLKNDLLKKEKQEFDI